jgi:hypothetical protein
MTFNHVLICETLFKERLNRDKDGRTFCCVFLLEQQKHTKTGIEKCTWNFTYFDSVLIKTYSFYCCNNNSVMYIFF